MKYKINASFSVAGVEQWRGKRGRLVGTDVVFTPADSPITERQMPKETNIPWLVEIGVLIPYDEAPATDNEPEVTDG